jgi:hypothetical protein
MKNLKIIACIAIVVLELYFYIVSYKFYINLFSFDSFYSFNNVLTFFQVIIAFLKNVLLFVLIGIFLFSSSAVNRDKAYRFIRFIVVMNTILYLPTSIYWYIKYTQPVMSYVTTLVDYGAAVLFLVAKPENPVGRVNLANYELVAFTSAGHRFVHYLLDTLFLLPFFLMLISLSASNYYGEASIFMQIYLTLITLIYLFLAEAIFRQTFGKIITGSVVVSNGPHLSTGRILLRTIARLIPFDAISFLFGANWHDKTTSTAVVYNNTWEKAFPDTNTQ